MFTAEDKRLRNRISVIAYAIIGVLLIAGVYLVVQNRILLDQYQQLVNQNRELLNQNKELLNQKQLLEQNNLLLMKAIDPPIMVGDGSIIFQHQGGGINQSARQELSLQKARKAKSLRVEKAGAPGSGQTILLSDGWSLSDSNTPGFSLTYGSVRGNQMRYTAHCPLDAGWSKDGSAYKCDTATQLTPITLNLPNGTCPNTAAGHSCILGGGGKWNLYLNF